jgi:hypothetical protein
MTMYPDVLRRAQAAIDAVVGSPDSADSRLPDFEDREAIPYMEAFLKELYRCVFIAT